MKPIDAVSREVLRDTPFRVLQFLRGAGMWRSIRHVLEEHGYMPAEHDLGWRLLMASMSSATARDGDLMAPTRDAVSELADVESPLFRSSRAALDRLHPEQGELVFHNLEPAGGAGAVASVALFLERLDALESDPNRAQTREADQAALQTLAVRGVGPDKRAQLRRLVDVAMNVSGVGADSVDEATDGPEFARHQRDLLALYAWYVDWAAVAKAYIRRREQLVRLGLGRRRKRKGADEATTPTTTGGSPPDAPIVGAPPPAAPPAVPPPPPPSPIGSPPIATPVEPPPAVPIGTEGKEVVPAPQ